MALAPEPKLGVGPETLRKWVLQAQVDGGQGSGATSEKLAEMGVEEQRLAVGTPGAARRRCSALCACAAT